MNTPPARPGSRLLVLLFSCVCGITAQAAPVRYLPVAEKLEPRTLECDVAVYGGTPGGVTAAVQAYNLLVPVSLSASHVAFGSIRMEPVFMILGQSDGTATALAIEKTIVVQEVTFEKLKEPLVKQGQRL